MIDEAEVETEAIRVLIRIMNMRDAAEQAKLAGSHWHTKVIWFEAQERKLSLRYDQLMEEEDDE